MLSKWCLVLLLICGHIAGLNADILSGAVCSLGALGAAALNMKSVLDIQPCQDAFTQDMKPYLDAYGSDDLPAFVVCCRINNLESCISRKIEEKCGEGSAVLLKAGVETVLKAAKLASNGEMDCVGNAYYKPESPLCWGIPIQIGVGFLLLVLLLCCCCGCICRRRSKGSIHGRSGTPTTLGMIPTHQVQYQPAPYNKSAV